MTGAIPGPKWSLAIYNSNGLEDQYIEDKEEIYRLAKQTSFSLLYRRNTLIESHCLVIRWRQGHYYTAEMLCWYDFLRDDV